MDFETKLAAAGETLEKLAEERGLNLNDFTEEETIDLLSTIMGEDGGAGAGGEPEPKVASETPAQPPAPVQQPQTTKVAYQVALAEVMKVAQANGYDLNQASPEELHKAVEDMQQIMSDPQYGVKQAALQEKIAEADALGRVMAHAYVDELGKIASAQTPAPTGDTTAEKKAAFVRELRAKLAGEMPPQFRKDKEDKKGDDKGDKDEEKEKEAFAKQASFRAAEILIANGINPSSGEKFASDQERIDAGAMLLLQQKGYTAS